MRHDASNSRRAASGVHSRLAARPAEAAERRRRKASPRRRRTDAASGPGAPRLTDSLDAPTDTLGIAGHAGSRATGVPAAADSAEAVDQSQWQLELCDHDGRRTPSLVV